MFCSVDTVLSFVFLITVISIGKLIVFSNLISKSFTNGLVAFPLIEFASTGSWTVPSFSVIRIDTFTSVPTISPLSSNFCKLGIWTDTLTLSTFVSVIDLVTEVVFVTSTFTGTVFSIAFISYT